MLYNRISLNSAHKVRTKHLQFISLSSWKNWKKYSYSFSITRYFPESRNRWCKRNKKEFVKTTDCKEPFKSFSTEIPIQYVVRDALLSHVI